MVNLVLKNSSGGVEWPFYVVPTGIDASNDNLAKEIFLWPAVKRW